MTTPLLSTKLFIPSTHPNLIQRPRLNEQLNEALSRRITLISAPAGFGKTTLVSTWISQIDKSVAWLSLDEDDNQIARFLAYLAAAIQNAGIELDIDPDNILQSPQLPSIETILTTLVNDIARGQNEFVLVLDDFHVIEAPSVYQALTFILDHVPPQMHLAIATRSDPNISLARLRGLGQISELRAKDLRFSSVEAREFVEQIIGTKIESEQVDILNKRAEGWAAGLQLAAVSMKDVDDISEFISTFAGDHRYIVDYLVDEVLAHCSDNIRDFLLQTSILDRLSAPLSDELLERSDSQLIIDQLERDNLFILPLDDRREWYRYHHLFAELLRHCLRQTYPERIDDLYSRACHWLEENGFVHQAVKHAQALENKNLAADLVERNAKTLLIQGQFNIMLDWFNFLPKELIRERPLLCVYQSWALVFDRPDENYSAIEELLMQAHQNLDQSKQNDDFVNTIGGHIASIRALISQPPAQQDHNPHAVLEFLNKAQELLPKSETEVRSINNVNIGYEYLHLGDADSAQRVNETAFIESQAGNNHIAAIVSICSQALISYYRGELDKAISICENGIESFNQLRTLKGQPLPILGMLFVTLGYLLVERGDMKAAGPVITNGIDLLQWIGEYELLSLGHIAATRLNIINSDIPTAVEVLEKLECQWPACIELSEILKFQVGLSQVETDTSILEKSLSWLKTHQGGLEDDSENPGISPWAETQHLANLTWIQIQIARFQHNLDSSPKPNLQFCLKYLNRRLKIAQNRGLEFRIVECSVLKSLVLEALEDTENAIDTLTKALIMAEPEGYTRVFLDKGQPIVGLLKKVSAEDESSNFAKQLLAEFDALKNIQAKSETQNLVEPLSDRELEVLMLIAQGLTNREISERLFLALDTVKSHNRRIFGKLGVKNRAQAINKATTLKIISTE